MLKGNTMQRIQVYGLSELPLEAVQKHSAELHVRYTDSLLADMHRGHAGFDVESVEALQADLLRIAEKLEGWERMALRRVKANIDRGEFARI